MVENSTTKNEVTYEGLNSSLIEDINNEVSFEGKIKSCITQIAKNPEDKTIENILNYSKTFRNL